MGQFPVPAYHVKRLLSTAAVFAIIFSSALVAEQPARADDSVTQESTGPKVDLDILNANLLSVVRALKLQSGAEIVVEGGDKAYNSVSLTVSGSLPTVLGYVADSAGATVTRNSDGVYVLRPVGAAQTVDAEAVSTPSASSSDGSDAQVEPTVQTGPLHWERVRLQYVSPKYVLMMLNDKEGERDVNTSVVEDQQTLQQSQQPQVYIPVQPFSLNSPNAGGGQQEQPSVPNGQGMTGGTNATMANQFTTNSSSQAQQFVPPFQQGGGGGFGNVGGGQGGGQGGAQNSASLRPDGIKSIISDEQDNSLLVQGDADGIQQLRNIIQLLDVPAKQVQIKAEFITASVATVNQFGINFQLVPAPNLSTSFTGSTVAGSSVVEFSQGNLVAEMQAQLSVDDSKVVSAPLITTTNNTAATIQFNEQIPYVTSTTSVNGAGGNATTSGVAFLAVSSGLTVTPQINGDNSVTMILNLPSTTTNPSADASLPPTTTTQVVHTIRTVANGETMVIGGLVSKNDSNARVSVPFLGTLPIIGSLFRTRNINDANTELLIFITPTVLPYPGQSEAPPPAIDSQGVGVTP
jgi:general secretion pathway protein D